MSWAGRVLGVVGVAFVLGCPADNSDAGADGDDSSSGGSDGGGTATSAASTATNPTTAGTNPTTAGPTTETTTGDDGADTGSTGEPGGGACFESGFVSPPEFGPDYEDIGVTVASHCRGSDHQDIEGIQRVVFLGDSITVGTPPTPVEQNYRSVLALALEQEFDVSLGANALVWFAANPFEGTAWAKDSGDFTSCAEWGARNDDMLPAGGQLEQCFPPETQSLRTLTIITSGGNDLSNMTKRAIDGATMEELEEQAEEIGMLMRETLDWLTDTDRFPSGNFVIFGNIYEFTDGTGDVQSCDVSGLAGFDMPVPAPEELKEVVVGIQERYAEAALATDTDLVFMLEEFCGHGFNNENPEAPCYRGPGAARWFDLTCIHPNPTGHQELADMFMDVVLE